MSSSRAKRRFPKWAAILALAVIGVLACVFITLVFFLYWLEAPAPLPDPARLVLKAPDLYFVARPDLSRPATRKWVQALLAHALRHAPQSVRHAAEYGLDPRRAAHCPIQIVLSARDTGSKRPSWVAALSLGRFRGAIWLADRSLYQKAKSGRIPFALQRRGDVFFYERRRGSHEEPSALAVWRATGLAGSGIEAVGEVFDALEAKDFKRTLGSGALGEWTGRGVLAKPAQAVPFLLQRLMGGAPKAKELLLDAKPIRVRFRVDEDERLSFVLQMPFSAFKPSHVTALRKALARFEKEGVLTESHVRAEGKVVTLRGAIPLPAAEELGDAVEGGEGE